MGIKVIFLDVDGVLNCSRTTKRLSCASEFLFADTRKILRLRKIVEETGAKLVLSSTWRFGAHPRALYTERESLRELAAEFRRLRCPLWFDITPYLPQAKRQKEIYAWLKQHPEVDDFIILDDVGEELMWYWDHLVLTDPRIGLNNERMEQAIKMLGEKND